MSMHKDWPRWIFASLCKHFDTHRDELPLIIEGQELPTNTAMDKIELRIDGPRGTELSKDYWYLYMEINVLVSSVIDNANLHKIHTSVGIVAAAFHGQIPVYKYGKNAGDDDTLLGCLQLIQDRGRNPISINHYGQPDPETRILQSSVEGHYFIHLEH